MRVYKLTPQLWFSATPDPDVLHKERPDVVVSLSKKGLGSLTMSYFDSFSFDYHYVPVPDGILHTSVKQKMLETAVLVAGHLRAGRSVLVHCLGGHNRSPTVAGLALVLDTHCSGAEAVDKIRETRRATLQNDEMLRWLRALEGGRIF